MSGGLVFRAYADTTARRLPGHTPGNVRLGGPLIVRDFFGMSGSKEAGPQAYVYDVVPEHTYVGAHFHDVDQFQLFFPAPDSWYLRSPMGGPLVLYADAYTTYGPFGTEEEPLAFFTMRPVAARTTGYMPGARDQLRKRPGRNHALPLAPHLGRAVGAGEVAVEELVDPQDDGLAVRVLTVGPSATLVTPPSPARCAGQYACVLGGTAYDGGRALGSRSLGWTAPGDEGGTLDAGPDEGFQLLVCQFPVDTTSDLGRVP